MTDVKYGFSFNIDDKGLLRFLDLATGKTKTLGNVTDLLGKRTRQGNVASGFSFKKLAATIGVTAAATWALHEAMQAVRAVAYQLAVRPIVIAADFEVKRIQLLQFLGTMQRTRQVMAELEEFAARTPFQLPGIAQATRKLLAYGGATFATQENLRLVGDAAAATGQDMQNMAWWFGRAYAAIQSGAPLGLVKERMAEFGLVIPGVFEQLSRLRVAGADTGKQWALFRTQFERTSGAMERLSQTFQGRVSTMRDTWELFLKSIGEEGPLFVAKEILNGIIAALDRLRLDKDLQAAFGRTLAEGMLVAAEAGSQLGLIMVNIGEGVANVIATINGELSRLSGRGIGKWAQDAAHGFNEAAESLRKYWLLINDPLQYSVEFRAPVIAAEQYNDAVKKSTKLIAEREKAEQYLKEAMEKGYEAAARSYRRDIAFKQRQIDEQQRVVEKLGEQIEAAEQYANVSREVADAAQAIAVYEDKIAAAEAKKAIAQTNLLNARRIGDKTLIENAEKRLKTFQAEIDENQKLIAAKREEFEASVKAKEGEIDLAGKLRKGLQEIQKLVKNIRGNYDELKAAAKAAEDALTATTVEVDPNALKRAQALEKLEKLFGKLRQKVDVYQEGLKQVDDAYRIGAVGIRDYLYLSAVLLDKIAEPEVKQAEQILKSLQTQEERFNVQIEILQNAAARLIKTGELTEQQINEAIGKLRQAAYESRNQDALSIIQSTIPQRELIEQQIATLLEYRDRVIAISQQMAAEVAAAMNAPYQGEYFEANVSDIERAIVSLRTQIQPLFDWVGSLQTAFNGLFQGIIDGTLDLKDVAKSVLSQLASNLASFLAKKVQLLVSSDAVEEALSKKKIARTSKEAAADVVGAQAGIFNEHSKIPFVGVAIALGFIAIMLAAMRKGRKDARQVTAFARGGYADKPTYGVFGEAGGEYLVPEKDMSDLVKGLIQSGVDLATRTRQPGQVTNSSVSNTSSVVINMNQEGPVFNTEREFREKIARVNRVYELDGAR